MKTLKLNASLESPIGDLGINLLLKYPTKPKRIRKKYFAPKVRTKVATVVDESYRIKVANFGFFVKETRTNLRYNMTGKVFANRATVLRKLKQLQSKNYKCDFEVEVNHTPIEVMV